MPSQPLSLFISYSHRDEALKQELEDHLALLKLQNKIRPWQDRQVETLSPAPAVKDDGWATPPPPKPSPGESSPGVAQTTGRNTNMEPAQRLQLFTALSSLPGPQFSQLVFTLNPPPGNVPPASAPQANRVDALLQWADSPMGPGLATLDSLLTEISGGPQVGAQGLRP